MRMNERMRTGLDQASPADFAEGEDLSPKLSRLLAEGFTDLHGAVVFAAMRETGERVTPDNFPDLTGYECFVNHIHVDDQVDDSLSERELLKQGIAFALATERRLSSEFPSKPFKVIVAANTSGCGARFHSVRPGEEWLASNLEGYADEAILVLDA